MNTKLSEGRGDSIQNQTFERNLIKVLTCLANHVIKTGVYYNNITEAFVRDWFNENKDGFRIENLFSALPTIQPSGMQEVEHNLSNALEWIAIISGALQELVELKKLKDSQGKTRDYESRQTMAWHSAFQAVELFKKDDGFINKPIHIIDTLVIGLDEWAYKMYPNISMDYCTGPIDYEKQNSRQKELREVFKSAYAAKPKDSTSEEEKDWRQVLDFFQGEYVLNPNTTIEEVIRDLMQTYKISKR